MGYRGVKHDCVIGIDPGEDTGWSLYVGASLWYATSEAFTKTIDKPPTVPEDTAMTIVVIENPVIYPERGGADPKSLLNLARKVGRFEEWYAKNTNYTLRLVEPRQWKGTQKKNIHHKHVLGRLRAAEIQLLPKNKIGNYDHNMVDAVGIGCYQLECEDQR